MNAKPCLSYKAGIAFFECVPLMFVDCACVLVLSTAFCEDGCHFLNILNIFELLGLFLFLGCLARGRHLCGKRLVARGTSRGVSLLLALPYSAAFPGRLFFARLLGA